MAVWGPGLLGERGNHEETLSSPQTSPVLYPLGASTPVCLVHGHGSVSDYGAVRAQTKAGFRSWGPGKHLPAADPTWMQPRRSAAQRLRINRKRLVDGGWSENRPTQVRDALLELLRLGDHAHGCCNPPHQGVRWPLSGSSAIA